jgi:EAL domain-containing protein (putative c-di-GMP-specific phosphodiesterase class I)
MQFIPQLEREGSVCRLDYYVLEETCRFIRKRLDEGKKVPCISVNFSRRHLEEDYLVKKIVNVIDKYGIDHGYIEIELTESEDFQNYEIMSEIVDGLRSEGIATSIDDFGTGYSSLNMIKKVDLNVIKIDKSFIPMETEYPDPIRQSIILVRTQRIQFVKIA